MKNALRPLPDLIPYEDYQNTFTEDALIQHLNDTLLEPHLQELERTGQKNTIDGLPVSYMMTRFEGKLYASLTKHQRGLPSDTSPSGWNSGNSSRATTPVTGPDQKDAHADHEDSEAIRRQLARQNNM